MDRSEAVAAAVRSCIADGILVDYLTERGAEVISMVTANLEEDAAREKVREDARKEGLQRGVRQGIDEMSAALAELGVAPDIIERAAERTGGIEPE